MYFLLQCAGGRILKISQHLAKVRAKCVKFSVFLMLTRGVQWLQSVQICCESSDMDCISGCCCCCCCCSASRPLTTGRSSCTTSPWLTRRYSLHKKVQVSKFLLFVVRYRRSCGSANHVRARGSTGNRRTYQDSGAVHNIGAYRSTFQSHETQKLRRKSRILGGQKWFDLRLALVGTTIFLEVLWETFENFRFAHF